MPQLSQEDRRDIQAVITTGYGHLPSAGFLFLRFLDAERARRWLDGIVAEVTTAAPWEKDARGRKLRPSHSLNLALTYDGLVALGLPEEARAGLPTEFVLGMPQRADVLGDTGGSAPDAWELAGLVGALHGVLLVYAPDDDTVAARLDALAQGLEEVAEEVAPRQRGARTERSREPFGFASDGISQPRIEGVRAEDLPGPWVVRTGEFILGHLNELGVYPLSPGVSVAHDPERVLPPFPEGALPACRDFGRNGSYLVYRKLAQDVAAFWRFVQERTARDDDRDRQGAMVALAAKLMGRWPSGAPLVLAPWEDDPQLAEDNDFMYRPTDETGMHCPIGAHVRRANPRDSIGRIRDSAADSIRSSNQHRLLRRGVPFGAPLFPGADLEAGRAPLDLQDDGEPRGLHFFAVNADIKRQFEFVTQTWLNNPTFNGLYENKDPIVSDNDGTQGMTIQRRPVRGSVPRIPSFVTVQGGAYLFLPSIRALRYLIARG